jgi:hypothetical protein
MRRFDRKGEITERQLAAVLKVIKQDAGRAERQAQWEEEAKDAEDAPAGKVTVTGEILSVKSQETMYGSSLKMVVKTEDGWKLWVTVPTSILSYRLSSVGGGDNLPGKTVTLTATVTPSDRDSKFAFGKRPSNAKLVS